MQRAERLAWVKVIASRTLFSNNSSEFCKPIDLRTRRMCNGLEFHDSIEFGLRTTSVDAPEVRDTFLGSRFATKHRIANADSHRCCVLNETRLNLVAEFVHGLDFDGRVKRQCVHADRGSCMLAAVSKDFDAQF